MNGTILAIIHSNIGLQLLYRKMKAHVDQQSNLCYTNLRCLIQISSTVIRLIANIFIHILAFRLHICLNIKLLLLEFGQFIVQNIDMTIANKNLVGNTIVKWKYTPDGALTSLC